MLMLAQGSAHALPLRDESVQMCVTSPPYWGLRAYAGEQQFVWGGEPGHEHQWGAEVGVRTSSPQQSRNGPQGVVGPREQHPSASRTAFSASMGAFCECGAWYGALGLEPTPELYVEHTVAVFREVRRVLRKDGTLWLNLGDSYAAGGKGGGGSFMAERKDAAWQSRSEVNGWRPAPAGMKAKDLVGIPWMVAFALRADGWWLRSDIVWSKPNPMPESVTDRPTKSHEYLFLLTKSERYFYDADAIREPHARLWDESNGGSWRHGVGDAQRVAERGKAGTHSGAYPLPDPRGRNARSVWEIATQPYPGAHFATYPERLAERCILAGSSPQACAVCGAPWERVTEREGKTSREWQAVRGDGAKGHDLLMGKQGKSIAGGRPPDPTYVTTGWQPTCEHGDGSTSSIVLDPFNGSGTTGRVALRHGRRYVGLDISREYLTGQSRTRIDRIQHEMAL